MEGKIWTKDAERDQLRKIRELIEETEVGSYIRMTFAGVCEICEDNISSDMGVSPVEDYAEFRKRRLKEDAEHGERLRNLERERDIALDQMRRLEEKIAMLEHMCDSKDYTIAGLRGDVQNMTAEVASLRNRNEYLNAENIRIKAKLYDLIEEKEEN